MSVPNAIVTPALWDRASASLIFSPYKDTSIHMNWNTNVISTSVSGTATPLPTDLAASGGKAVTLAFATGECGSENWGGGAGSDIASANVSLLSGAGVNYILSTGGAAGSFTCGTDAGFGGEFQALKNVYLRGGYTTQTAITGGSSFDAARGLP